VLHRDATCSTLGTQQRQVGIMPLTWHPPPACLPLLQLPQPLQGLLHLGGAHHLWQVSHEILIGVVQLLGGLVCWLGGLICWLGGLICWLGGLICCPLKGLLLLLLLRGCCWCWCGSLLLGWCWGDAGGRRCDLLWRRLLLWHLLLGGTG
jgi:hypothetical protein